MEKNSSILAMPIRGKPFAHQQRAYEFVCRVFGLLGLGQRASKGSKRQEEGDANGSNQ